MDFHVTRGEEELAQMIESARGTENELIIPGSGTAAAGGVTEALEEDRPCSIIAIVSAIW